MLNSGIWFEPRFLQTAVIIITFVFISSLGVLYLEKKNQRFKHLWESLKSWFLLAPILLFVLGLPQPWPLAALALTSIYSSKTFFKMVGIYHRHWFVICTYIFIILMSWLIYIGHDNINLLPMIFLATICCIPIFKNNYKNMIQYIALTFLAFTFLGWSILHFGQLMFLEQGIYIVMYLFFLSELNDLLYWTAHWFFGKTKILDRLAPQLSLEGLVISSLITLAAAWGFKYLLPEENNTAHWVVAYLTVIIFGRVGDLVMTTIRKDLGVKLSGLFIIGRNDLLSRVDKMIFVAPIYYYAVVFLKEQMFI